ncbi:glycosyltransferase [Leisingera daeponensis]|uniref:Glycosyltransferase n=1 Tax=Leisingera daeponensis TaxID=405746 RepID=A0ABS7NIY3_9RHOB|nr:glycosyltransferase [Leisingera daeponensis]MBY6140861.1 glycosyltransferase [Leisingera daeponensis]
MQPQRIAFALPHLKAGGIEMVVKSLLCSLDRSRWAPLLILNRAEGELLAQLPSDLPMLACGGKGLLLRASAMARMLRKHPPAVLYAGTNAMNLSAVLAVCLLPLRIRPRLIISEHTTAENYLAGARHPRLRKTLIRMLYPRADRLAVPLQEIGEGWIEALALPGPPLACLPNPVLNASELDRLHRDPPNRRQGRIVAAGRLIPDKGHDVLIRAFAQVRQAWPGTRLLIYGTGPQRSALEALARSLGLSDHVRLMGYSPDLLREFARAELAVLPSLREGFGNVAVEALAAGTPLIASRCPGPEAILQGGKLGVLVPPGDANALAGAILEALRSPPEQNLLACGQEAAAAYLEERAALAFDRFASGLLSADSPPHSTAGRKAAGIR